MTTIIFDIEADGLLMDATRVWCAVAHELTTGKEYVFTQETITQLLKLLEGADVIVGHNILLYDLPLLSRLHGFKYSPSKCYDTMLVSQLLLPDREGGHSLKQWGIRLGLHKGDHTDFTQYSEAMLLYCRQDVAVTKALYVNQSNELRKHGEKIKQALSIEMEFAYLISKQILRGFTLDVPKAESLYQELNAEFEDIYQSIKALMPPVKDLSHYNSTKKAGKIISESDTGYLYYSRGKVVSKEWKLEEPNPSSRQQLGEWLTSKGWVPKEFTETGQPKIDEKTLITVPIEEAKLLARMFRVQKQCGMIKDGDNGWLKLVGDDSRVHGSVITIGTNTGRCSHNKPNMAQIDRKDLRMRDVWIPQPGWKLIGVDASGLELRILGHYLAPLDNGAFAHEVIEGDVHTRNQQAAGFNSRDSAKTLIYALIYGAGDMKLGTIEISDKKIARKVSDFKLRDLGKELRRRVLDNIDGYEQLINGVQSAYKNRGYLHGIDGRPLHPRSDYSALNLLIQSAGAVVMKQALIEIHRGLTNEGYTLDVDYGFVANVHDEVQLECRSEIADHIASLLPTYITKAGTELRLKVRLDGEAKVGYSWKCTH